MQRLGVHSEVGTLRRVMVCRPGLAHQRLTPGTRAELLFDDVLWVHQAQKDHYDFVLRLLHLHRLRVRTGTRSVRALAAAARDSRVCLAAA